MRRTARPGWRRPAGGIRVALGPRRAYDVHVVDGWQRLPDLLGPVTSARRALVVTDDQVGPRYAPAVRRQLARAGLRVAIAVLPSGERQKRLRRVAALYEAALDHRLERRDLVVALGGGVVGDLAGFVAATYLRGVDCVQLPTTLLAMVDASVGGKTGFNLSRGKNLVGAFHQPRLVYANRRTLETLPPREVRAGLAEVVKCGMIRDARLVTHLERHAGAVLALDAWAIETAIGGAVRTKARIVAADEREGGVRALLNYGHTVGHAIETVTRYRRYRHGEAVALGMIAAGELAAELGVAARSTATRQQTLIAALGLPVRAPRVDPAAILAALQRDKKVHDGMPRFVLTSKVGSASVHAQLPVSAIRRAINLLTRGAS
ncbi:MAG: 3-dehydroquinate synthase [Candidatus Eiseniibacteriota bacterium]|jgi:3-dehydroquinate synthase